MPNEELLAELNCDMPEALVGGNECFKDLHYS